MYLIGLLLIVFVLLVYIILSRKKGLKNRISIPIIVVLFVTIVSITIYKKYDDRASKKEYRVIEEYIYNEYKLQLETKEFNIVYRGDIGINPGKEYIFKLQDKAGNQYEARIDTYSSEATLQEALKEPKKIEVNKIE